MPSPRLSRRDWLKLSAAGFAGYSLSGWLGNLAASAAADPARKRSCILLWMNGGPSQMDTFDLKPGTPNGGPFKETQTSAPGLKISEHLPQLAKHGHEMAVIRSMSTKEGDHTRATFLMRTGNLPQGAIEYPTLGSLLSKELGDERSELPNFVSIAPVRFLSQAAYNPGFLGPQYAPLIVGDANNIVSAIAGGDPDQVLKVADLEPPADVNRLQADSRVDLLRDMETEFLARHPGAITASHQAAYDRAVRLMRSSAARAFTLSDEPDKVRDAYGRNLFGQGCLLARRLVERGVPFVEVTLSGVGGNNLGWDTHQNNFEGIKSLSAVLDPAWAMLMDDLKQRGLLETTTIVWMGEFGRTPKINGNNGRDHFPNAWSTVLAGGGIKGGQAFGKTSKDGMTVEERPVPVPDLLSTVCHALGIDPSKQNLSNVGRPIRIVDKAAQPIREVLA
jgi:hypothetical protein